MNFRKFSLNAAENESLPLSQGFLCLSEKNTPIFLRKFLRKKPVTPFEGHNRLWNLSCAIQRGENQIRPGDRPGTRPGSMRREYTGMRNAA